MPTQTYLRYGVIGLLFIIPFVGFILSPNLFFPYITGKNLFFRLIVEIAAVLYALLAIGEPRYRPKLSTITIAFLSFITVIFAADVFGVYPFKSFWSNFERMEGFFTHLHLFAYFVMLSAVFIEEKLWIRFFQTSLGASVIMAFISFDLTKSQGGRVFANLGNSTYLGIYMLFHVFFAALLITRLIQRKGDLAAKWLIGLVYAGVIVLNLYVLYKTGTRSAFLGLLFGAFIASVAFAFWEKHKGIRTLGVTALIAVVLSMGALASFKDSDYVKNQPLLSRFAKLATFDSEGIQQLVATEGKGRLGIWGIAIQGFKERPILGWGQENFNYVFDKYYDPKIYDQEQWFDRAHNVFLDWLIAGGLLGLIAYLALFGVALIMIWKKRHHHESWGLLFSDKVLLTALLVAYFIHNLFVFDSITSYILFFGVLAFIDASHKKIESKYVKIEETANIMFLRVVSVGLGIVSLYYFTIAPYISASSLIQGLTFQSYAKQGAGERALKESLKSYEKALSYDGVVGIGEVREQFLLAAPQMIGAPEVSDEFKIAYYNRLMLEIEKIKNNIPPDARTNLLIGSFYAQIGQIDMATSSYEKALEVSPRKQTILMQLGSLYLDIKQYDKALTYLKKSYESAPSYNEARFLYAVGLIYANKLGEADQVLLPLKGTKYMGDLRLLRAYYTIKLQDRLQKAIMYKLEYAEELVNNGDKEAAIQQINEVIKIAPNFEAEGQKRIDAINRM